MNYRDIIKGKESGIGVAAARLGLSLCEWPYSGIMRLRNFCYRHGFFRSWKIPVPVISVGNITAGGTGKTPMVAYLAKTVIAQGFKPVILSRGYGKKKLQLSDEALVLRDLLPETPHLQHPNRVLAASVAITRHLPDVILLDDAFQHQRIRRDLNILLIDAACPFGYGHLLPRGLLREPIGAVRRADCIVITKVYQTSASAVADIRKRLAEYTAAPVFESTYRLTGIRRLDGQDADESLSGANVFLACGVAAPESVESLLTLNGAKIAGRSVFPDHHVFSPSDFELINRLAQKTNAGAIVFTRKDAVKIPAGVTFALPTLTIDIEFTFQNGEEQFLQLLKEVLTKAK